MRIRDNGGLQRLIDDLERLSAEMAPARVKARLDPITAEMTEELRTTMPVRTGALKSSGHWSSDASSEQYEAEVRFGDGLDYAGYVLNKGTNDDPREWETVLPTYE